MFDLTIVNGTVFDGTGGVPVRQDIGVRDGRIAALGGLVAAESAATIDAGGSQVCPGFIDAHSHSGKRLLIEPSARSKIFQGVTTEVLGNCGTSPAPITGKYRRGTGELARLLPGTWQSVAEYRALWEQVRPAVNGVLLVGHNNLRGAVVGYAARAATDAELREMTHLLEAGLAEGARGLSTGLIYTPGMFAAPGEISVLAAAAAGHGGVYTSHMRNEGELLLASIDETLAVGRETGIKVQISHLKARGADNWSLLDTGLERIRSARAQGVPVCADRYPYIASSTTLDVVFPKWMMDGGHDAELARLRDPADRARLREELLAGRMEDYWGTILVCGTSHPDNKRFQGKKLTQIADALDLEPVDALLRIVEADELGTGAVFFGMCEENLAKVLAEPYVMIGSDASVRAPTGPLSHDHPHPRGYGSFPKFLRAALDGKTVALPEAIRKMTGLPAAQFGLGDRGVIAMGKAADLLVFDPATVRDRATYEQPHQLAAGIAHVIVNGVPAVRDGELTGQRAGQLL